jgi:DNA-binding transcriptional LysR family regulator
LPQLPRPVSGILHCFDAIDDEIDDLAVRIGVLADQTWIVRRVGMAVRVVFGAPAYFAARGHPITPGDLRNHKFIVYKNLRGQHRRSEWRFTGRDRRLNVRFDGNFLANNSEALRETVLCGIGVAVAPTWMFQDEMAKGLVTTVLRDYELERLPIQL